MSCAGCCCSFQECCDKTRSDPPVEQRIGLVTLLAPSTTTPAETAFQLVGELSVDLDTIDQRRFRLNSVQHSTPIDGTICVQMKCDASDAISIGHEAFLVGSKLCCCARNSHLQTMYEDVAGLGSWTRYWSVLSAGVLRLWRYPDEATTKDPLAVIDLSMCITERCRPLSEVECVGRPHAFRLDICAEPTSYETFKSVHLLMDQIGNRRVVVAADDNDNFTVWLCKLNETLRNLQLWRVNKRRQSHAASSRLCK